MTKSATSDPSDAPTEAIRGGTRKTRDKDRTPAGGKLKVPRKRGPRNRFMTPRDLENERTSIIHLLSTGAKVADVAEALDISVATLYRRVGKSNPKDAPVTKSLAPVMAEALKTALVRTELEQQRAIALASKRMARIQSETKCCEECRRDKISLRLLELSNAHHQVLVKVLQKSGYLDEVRAGSSSMAKYAIAASAQSERAIDGYLQALASGQPYASTRREQAEGASNTALPLHIIQHMIDVLGDSGDATPRPVS